MFRRLSVAAIAGLVGLGLTAGSMQAASAQAASAQAGSGNSADHRGGHGRPHSGVYLALGDSLAAGYQPGAGDDKTGGYVGEVYRAYRSGGHHGTKLVDLACSGETSASLISGSLCSYGRYGNSQLNAALGTIKAQHGKVRLITLDIGANDVDNCVSGAAIDMACVSAGLKAVATNVPTVVAKLRAAAGPRTQIIVLNYYNPFLAVWLAGGQATAQASSGLQQALNGYLAAGAAAGKGQVADVAGAYRSYDWSLVNSAYGSIPANVNAICTYTWMCSKNNIHANDAGYRLMASAVTPLLRR